MGSALILNQIELPAEDDQQICVVLPSYKPWDLLTITQLIASGIVK